ncbi:unnamed protein product [Porites lobata]|uniref:Transcription initiation factor IIF subunit alpha n=1 Tax=Porites lobata TaxID=104759 RepID=A0ABN8S926_9CNID|nr:unnamed protein product [Porites lobata]
MANQVIRALFVYSLALFYGFMVCFFLLLTAIRNLEIPRRGKRREKPPACLLDPELGEHHFLRTASNIRIHYVAKGDTGKPLMLCIHGFPEIEALDYKSCTLLSHDWGGALAWNCHPKTANKERLVRYQFYNPGQKSLGQYCNIHIFLSFLGSLLKQCIVFEIFLQFSVHPPYTKLKLGKNSGYTREGLGLRELENAPEMQKCSKTFAHDCRSALKSCLGSLYLSRKLSTYVSSVCKGDEKKKKKCGSGSSISSNSRSSTPTIATDGAANTIAAAATKLNQDRPGTPSKSKKRLASASEKGTPGEEGSPASKKPRVSPAPSAGGAGGGSRTSTPTPAGSGEGPQGIAEEALRRYLTRKPMTSKDLLQKFKSKRTGLLNDETVKKLAAIVRKIQPEQKTIKGKLYLSLKPQS